MDLQRVLDSIKDIFINESKYGFDKHIWEFTPNSKYLGDAVLFSMAETTNPPHFISLFLLTTTSLKKAPQHALVFKNGNLILDTDYTEYADIRTGAMDTLLLQSLGMESLADKKILMYGKGKIATWSQSF